MAYIFSSDEVQGTTTATSATAPIPTHTNNDIILVIANKDGTGSMSETSSSGYNNLTGSSDGGGWGGVWWKRATGSSETAASFTFALDTYHIVTIVIRGAHTSQDPAATLSSIDSTRPWTQNQTITTTWNNSLIIHGFTSDGGVSPTPLPGESQALYYGDAGANSCGIAWKFYPTSGSSVNVNFDGRINDSALIHTIEIRDDGSNSIVHGYVADSQMQFLTQFTNATAGEFFTSLPTSVTISSMGGKTVTYDALGNATDRGINPYMSTFLNSPVANPAGDTLYGAEAGFSSQDWSGNYLLSSFAFTTPRDWVDFGFFDAHKGTTFTLLDAGNDYKSWIVGAKDSPTTKPDGRNLFAIQPGQSTDTSWASSGTFNADAIDTLMAAHSSPFGATSIYLSYLMVSGVATLAGGTSATPLDFTGVVDGFVNGSSLYPILQREGSAATIWNPIKFGGVDPIHVNVNLRTFQFPVAYNATTRVCNWHVDTDQVGVEFDARSGDTCSFTNCVFTSDSRYYWRIAASASNSAAWDFSGTSVAGALVTLRDVTTFSSMSFINSTVDASNCDLTNSTITDPPNVNNSLTSNASTTYDGCTFGVDTTSAGNYLTSVTDPSIFSDCNFQGTSSAGHAFRITSPGTYSFSGNTFTGFGADGTTSAAIYNDSGGAVTVNITGGGNTPTYRNGASASTTINNAVTLKITVKDEAGFIIQNARTAIYRNSDDAELMNELTNASGVAEASFNYTSDTDVYIRVRKSSTGDTKYFVNSSSGTVTSSGYSATVTLIEDTVVS